MTWPLGIEVQMAEVRWQIAVDRQPIKIFPYPPIAVKKITNAATQHTINVA